ncbi:ABC transporter permease [Bifidobacterium magnum]|uniref:ABC transporter permease n=1 Tax=Bifidobacterium magnum TaxID=1692 RepID=UPI001EE67016|nr:ABC transporter permease [Bifidobacterium magnum]
MRHVHVGSSDEDLQHAVASNYVDLLVMVPDGYVQHMAQALQDGRPLPELDVVMFTSGMAFPVSMMPAAMIAIGKFTPGWWFYQSIEALNGTGGSYSLAGWAANLALVALSGATFICLGLAVSRIRRARPSSQGSAVTQPAGN